MSMGFGYQQPWIKFASTTCSIVTISSHGDNLIDHPNRVTLEDKKGMEIISILGQ